MAEEIRWNSGNVIPTTVLYYYEGPTIFISTVGLHEFLFYKFDERDDYNTFLLAPIAGRTVEALQSKTLSVRGALAGASNFWVAAISPSWEVTRCWKITSEELVEYDLMPFSGVSLTPSTVPAADYIEQAISFFSARFLGEDLTNETVPFVRFKTLIDSAYDAFRKIFPPPVVDLKSLSRSLEFSLFQPKFSSVIVAIERPEIDANDASKYLKRTIDATDFVRNFDQNRSDFFDRMNELIVKAEKGEISRAYAVEHFATLDQVNPIIPTSSNALEQVEFRSQSQYQNPIVLDEAIGTRFRLAHKMAEFATREIIGSVIDINAASATLVLIDGSARQVTCIFDRSTFKRLNVSIGNRILVRGNFHRRKRRDRLQVTDEPRIIDA